MLNFFLKSIMLEKGHCIIQAFSFPLRLAKVKKVLVALYVSFLLMRFLKGFYLSELFSNFLKPQFNVMFLEAEDFRDTLLLLTDSLICFFFL